MKIKRRHALENCYRQSGLENTATMLGSIFGDHAVIGPMKIEVLLSTLWVFTK